MSGRSGRTNGRNGRGSTARGGRGRGRGYNYTGAGGGTKKGLCVTLGSHVYDYGQKNAADLMQTSWEKLVQYVGTTYGQDIANKLQNKNTVVLSEPVHAPSITARHTQRETVIRDGQVRILIARQAQEAVLLLANNPDDTIRLAILQNEIATTQYELTVEVPIVMTESEKTQHSNDWRTFRERNNNLVKHRGQAYSLILGQCTQLLQDKMKQDTDWAAVSAAYDPLTLFRLIEKTVLAQTEDQYPFATVYNQEIAFYSFKQDNMTNPQWYERFNTRYDIGAAIGVTRQHKVLLEYVAQELHTLEFDACTAQQQLDIRADAEERYIS